MIVYIIDKLRADPLRVRYFLHESNQFKINCGCKLGRTDHFTVVCLVAWPLNESEAGSTPASLSFKGQATEHITVKWSIRKLV